MKKIFVTGAAGFIGFHLIKALKKCGYQVLGIDNFNDYYSPLLKKDRCLKLKEMDCEIFKIDLVNSRLLQKKIEEFNPTHIVHLAAQAGVRYSLKNPDAYLQSNLIGFTNLLEAIKDKPHIQTIYASSSSVYGDNQKTPFSEKDQTDKPKNLYGATKKANELMAYAYHSLYDLKLIGMRFFTVYGPWGRPDMAYYLFSKAIMEGNPVEIYEGASIKRDFTYIDDIIEGILSALDIDSTYEVFNLGNNKPVLLNDFIETLEEALGKKAIKTYLPQAKGDMEVTFADISKSQEILGFNPKTDLRAGLQKFADWFTEYHSLKKQLPSPPQSQLPQSRSLMQ